MLLLIPSLDTAEDSLTKQSFTIKLQKKEEAGASVCVCVCVEEGVEEEVGSFESFHL